jgi:hypothetical protein
MEGRGGGEAQGVADPQKNAFDGALQTVTTAQLMKSSQQKGALASINPMIVVKRPM